jgi:hypothetical protein
MGASNTNISSCESCDSENLRYYSASFGKMPVKKYVQCLDCAWSREVQRREPPKHYDQKIEPWDVIDAWRLDFWEGNAVKYICRAGKKEDNTAIQDYEKAITYLEECIRRAKDG